MQELIFANGLRCLIHPMRNTHSVTVGLYVKAGPGYGEPFHGITHLLEHLHFRQLGDLSQRELYYRMEKIGSTLRGITYKNLLQFSMKVAPCYMRECLEIFAELIRAENWTEESLALEKKVVKNQIIESGDYTTTEKVSAQCVFQKHPLSRNIMGTAEEVDAIGQNNITAYKKSIFQPSNMLICMTGNFTEAQKQEMVQILSRCELPSNGEARKLAVPESFFRRKPDLILAHTDDDTRLDVGLSFDIRYEGTDRVYLKLLNGILGEGVGSKLQRRIREEKCYCADISSYMEWYAGFAVLQIRFSVEKKELCPCLEEILDVIAELKTSITKEEMETTVPFFTTNLAFYEDDTEEINYRLATKQLLFEECLRQSPIENDIGTVQKLQSLAQEIFTANNCSMVVLGNTRKLTQKQFREILSGI